MINIKLNGIDKVISKDITLDNLLKNEDYTLSEKEQNFVVAINQTVIPYTQYKQTICKEEDQIEILSAIVGG